MGVACTSSFVYFHGRAKVWKGIAQSMSCYVLRGTVRILWVSKEAFVSRPVLKVKGIFYSEEELDKS